MPKASEGYGGKFGVQKDRMDKVFLILYPYFNSRFFFLLAINALFEVIVGQN